MVILPSVEVVGAFAYPFHVRVYADDGVDVAAGTGFSSCHRRIHIHIHFHFHSHDHCHRHRHCHRHQCNNRSTLCVVPIVTKFQISKPFFSYDLLLSNCNSIISDSSFIHLFVHLFVSSFIH